MPTDHYSSACDCYDLLAAAANRHQQAYLQPFSGLRRGPATLRVFLTCDGAGYALPASGEEVRPDRIIHRAAAPAPTYADCRCGCQLAHLPPMKRCLLLLGLLLHPALASAYAGVSVSGGEVFLFLVVLAVPILGPLLLLPWAFRQPENRSLQVVQGLTLLGWQWLLLVSGRSLHWSLYSGPLPTLLYAVTSVALLLNGLTQTRLARLADFYRAWSGLAASGLTGLLAIGANQVLPRLAPTYLDRLQTPGQAGLAFGLHLLGWWVLVQLLRLRRDLFPVLVLPWWRTPALAGVGLLAWWGVQHLLLLLATQGGSYYWNWDWAWATDLSGLLKTVLLHVASGALVLRFTRLGRDNTEANRP